MIRAVLLILPEFFAERDLFERIAGLSSGGDIRMALPAENRNNVGNAAQNQDPQQYHRFTGRKGNPFTETPVGVTEGYHFTTQR